MRRSGLEIHSQFRDSGLMNAPVHRQLSPAATSRLLGTWHVSGPAYSALADGLRAAVLAGTLPPHTRLPSERRLAEALGVSRTTTAAAYRRLRDLGYARSRTGSGTVAVLPRTSGGEQEPPPAACAGDAPAPTSADGAGAYAGDDVVDLAQATPSAPPELHAAYERALEALPAYLTRGGYDPFGLPGLRRAIADRYWERGVPTSPDQILVTTGAQQAIALLASTFLAPRDVAVVQSPTYFHAMEALRGARGRLVGVPSGRDGLDLDLFDSTVRAMRPRVVYLVPDFHNPTGATLSPEDRERVAATAERHGTTIVGDETLTEVVLEGPGGTLPTDADLPSPFALDGRSDRLVSVGSASKAFWGGLRVGWVRAHVDLVARLTRTRQSADIATAVLEQLTVTELLGNRAAILGPRRLVLREARDTLVDGLREALPSWSVPRPAGGLSVWADVGRPVALAFAAAAAAEGVLVNAGPTFTPDATSRDHVRLTLTQPADAIARAIPRLVRAWERVT
jgi:DNA-binding transcriptional MocR family regulator